LPNQKNIDELSQALAACHGLVQVTAGLPRIEATVQQLAADLAAQGIVAPQALTSQQIRDLRGLTTVPSELPYQKDEHMFVRDLERIARGDP
jgi:hypothetical protein